VDVKSALFGAGLLARRCIWLLRIPYVLLALLLSGCAATHWVDPPGTSQGAAQQAEYECRREAEQPVYNPLSVYNNCMQRKGFRKERVVVH
jgi:hypothetical protein